MKDPFSLEEWGRLRDPKEELAKRRSQGTKEFIPGWWNKNSSQLTALEEIIEAAHPNAPILTTHRWEELRLQLESLREVLAELERGNG